VGFPRSSPGWGLPGRGPCGRRWPAAAVLNVGAAAGARACERTTVRVRRRRRVHCVERMVDQAPDHAGARRAGQPQQNGRHERTHRTLKLETPVHATLADQQPAFDRFRREFNEVRPHEALGQVPPARFYEPSRRPYPSRSWSPSIRTSISSAGSALAPSSAGTINASKSGCAWLVNRWVCGRSATRLGKSSTARTGLASLTTATQARSSGGERPARADTPSRDYDGPGPRDHVTRTVLPELLDRNADTQTTSPELPDGGY